MDKTILLKYKTMRKCLGCKEYIALEDNLDNIVYFGKGIHHIDCLKKDLLKKGRGKKSLEDVKLEVEKNRKISEKTIWNLVVKNHLFKWLMEHYEVVLLPTYIFTKVEQTFKGEWKGMSKPILPEHLLEMFERKQSYLDGIYHKEKLNGVSRINYDLAVLLAKYQAFLDWKERSASEEKETKIFIQENKVNLNKLRYKKEQMEENILEDGDD